MEPLQITERLRETYRDEIISVREFRGQVSVTLKRGRIREICRFLHDEPGLSFDYLMDLCGADYLGKKENRFEVVYHLYSMDHRQMVRLKAEVPEADPSIDSVVGVWAGANWHERETYDLFGIRFKGHPDLRRILLPEDWEGYPLRKDYPVKGPEKEWPGFLDVLERSRQYRQFDWHG